MIIYTVDVNHCVLHLFLSLFFLGEGGVEEESEERGVRDGDGSGRGRED